MSSYILYGIRTPYVHEILESIWRLGHGVDCYIDNLDDELTDFSLSPVLSIAELDRRWLSRPVLFGTITPGFKKIMYEQARELGFSQFAELVDPTAVVASSARLSMGVQINAAAVIGANTTLHDFVLVNRSASVGHDVVLHPYVSLGPACVLCGSIEVGAGSFIGAGSIVTPGRSIGKNCIVGAGAVVTRDVPDHSVVVGNPARVSKSGIIGYNGVQV